MYEWEVHTMNMKKQNWLGGKNQNSSKDYKVHPQGQIRGSRKLHNMEGILTLVLSFWFKVCKSPQNKEEEL